MLTLNKAPLQRSKAVALFLCLVLLGVAGNYLRYDIFFNIQFIFGGIFAMLALLLFGLWPGVAAGALIGSYTYVLWNHPYAIIIMTAEVLFVGLLTRRRKPGLVLADALYWLCIGMPLVLAFYYGAMHVALNTAVITMLKQALNGIANALIARLLFTSVFFRWVSERLSMRETLFDLLVLFCLFPALLLVVRDSRNDMAETDRLVREALELSGKRTGDLVNAWLDDRMRTVEHLAWMAGGASARSMQETIEEVEKRDENFLRMGLLDREATIVAYSPLTDELGRSNIGRNFRDRPFIPVLRQTLKPMLSEVVMGRIGVPKPMTTALAPVLRNGRYAGYVTGILDLGKIDAMIAVISQGSSLPAREYVLLDRNGRIILTSRKGSRAMDAYARGAGDDRPLERNIRQWVPAGARNVSVSDRWKNAMYYTEVPLGGISGWRLVLEQPMAPHQKLLYERYSVQLAWILGILAAALLIAELASKRIAAPLGKLGRLSSGLPGKLDRGESVTWPESAVRETQLLADNMREMAAELSSRFVEIRALNATLEQRVHDRTRELRESEERLRQLANEQQIILNTIAIGVIYAKERTVIWSNPAFRTIFGYSEEETHGLPARKLYADAGDYERVDREGYPLINAGGVYALEVPSHRKDGSRFWLSLTGRAVNPRDASQGSIWMLQDITERKAAAEKIRESEQLFREAIEFLPMPIGIADADGAIRTYNKSFVDTYGYTMHDLPTIEAWMHAAYREAGYREQTRSLWAQDVQRAVAEHGSTPTREYDVTCRNGRVKSVEIAMRPIGSLLIAAFYDVTARKRVEKDLLEKTLQLEDLTRNLEKRVREEIELRSRNEQILVQQSKLAAMGEMLGAIAHQWRQPLNAMGLIIQNLRDAHAYGELDRAYLERTVERSMAQVRHMSKTIDDFRNFFLPDKERTDFDSMQAVGDVLALLSAQLAANSIDVRLLCRTHGRSFSAIDEIVACPEKTVRGFRSEFEHVVMNLFNNAREAILDRREAGGAAREERGLISVTFDQAGDRVRVAVGDNGGGMPEAALARVFEPYFTTKGPAKGTGLGLYMSKVIIEEHMQGSLTARNDAHGALFTIELPRPAGKERP